MNIMKKKTNKPNLGRIPISKTGGPMKDKKKYNRKVGTWYDRQVILKETGELPYRLTKEEWDKINKEGHDPKTGHFTKGNKMNDILKENYDHKKMIKMAFEDNAVIEKLRELLNSKSDAVSLNAVKTILLYTIGQPRQEIEQKIKIEGEKTKEIPEEVLALLKNVGVKIEDEEEDSVNE